MIECIDCAHLISKHAKMCPSCGRPWPADGISPTKKIILKIVQLLTIENIWGLTSFITIGGILGAFIQNSQKRNPDFTQVSDYFWEDFLVSLLIGLPVLIIVFVVIILVYFLWLWICAYYLILENKVTKTRKYTDQENIVKKYSVERRRRTVLRCVLVSPILFLLVDFLN